VKRLKEVLQYPDTVLFIGSGVSCWSGLPTWPALIEHLARTLEGEGISAELVRAEAMRGDLLQATSYGFDKLTRQQIGQFIRSVTRYGTAQPSGIHRSIVSFGARCYITTNYDNLIEEALRRWQPDRFVRQPITNRQLTEMAEVVHARATDFIFKPHGDAGDSDSIILTREQYRQLLPGGERHATLETLKMLLATRAVVYIGFGLRDPDFAYVRDLLANTYKEGPRDHYAIVPDVTDPEVAYWRRNYGLHLIGYETISRSDGTKDHGKLLNLLSDLSTAPALHVDPAGAEVSPDTLLQLLKHAARLSRVPAVDPEFPLRTRKYQGHAYGTYEMRLDKYEHWRVEKLLDAGPDRFSIIGAPGAGKTYALRRSAMRLASQLHDTCLQEQPVWQDIVIPVLADLKLYAGNLWDTVEQMLPLGLRLDDLTRQFRLKILLDSFNELPRKYVETSSYEADFRSFLDRIGGASIIVGSRTTDGLGVFEFPAYILDEIDEEFVARAIAEAGLSIEGRFKNEFLQLLQKPFYFQLVSSNTISIPREPHPRDLYEGYFARLSAAFRMRFDVPIGLQRLLSAVAYEGLDQGEEAQPLQRFVALLSSQLTEAPGSTISSADVVNWLVSKEVLLPYSGERIAFFHQSVTEFLAATELARRYRENPAVAREKLALTRWDQALFLTLSMVPEADSKSFLQAIVDIDFPLALRAVKYLEKGREKVITELLQMVIRVAGNRNFGMNHKIAWALQTHVPVAVEHGALLRSIMRHGDMLGGAAATQLVGLFGSDVKAELLSELARRPFDYNYCRNGIASALRSYVVPNDACHLAALAETVWKNRSPEQDDRDDDGEIEPVNGFASGCAHLLSTLDLSIVADAFVPRANTAPMSPIAAAIVCDTVREHGTDAALDLVARLLLLDIERASIALVFVANEDAAATWRVFDSRHADKLIEWVPRDETWAVKALRALCRARPDLARWVADRAGEHTGLVRAVTRFCAAGDPVVIFEALEVLINLTPAQRAGEPVKTLDQINLDWSGRETLLVKLLRLRNVALAYALTNPLWTFGPHPVGELDIGAVDWWLEWLTEVRKAGTRGLFGDRMSWVLTEHVSETTRAALLNEFNRKGSKYRTLLADEILWRLKGITTDHFSAPTIKFLLTQLWRHRFGFRGSLLGHCATERFVEDILLPQLSTAKEGLHVRNLHAVLDHAARRHGRRYFSAGPDTEASIPISSARPRSSLLKA
jgi:SIR2-like domain